MITREISRFIANITKKYPVITITGPRQSGKTTLVKTIFREKPYVNLEHIETREFAKQDPIGFLKKYPEGAVIDEVQRVPELFSYIQVIVDEVQQMGMFILTGSSQFNLLSSITQSLAGRTALCKLLPFSISELSAYTATYTIVDFLHKGFYPIIYDRELEPSEALGNYIETYIERDLRQFSQIHNLSLFRKFIRMCAGRIGQLLNLSSIANNVGISHTTAREWLTILEASYIVFLLEPFYANIKKRLIKSPKLYFYDVGLASYLLGVEYKSQLQTHPLKGNLFENLIIMEIIKYRFNQGKRNNLHFYRDSNGREVDILYTLAQHHIPIEVKAGETITQDYFKGLDSFEKLFPELPYGKALIYGGERFETFKNTSILSCKRIHEFLTTLSAETG